MMQWSGSDAGPRTLTALALALMLTTLWLLLRGYQGLGGDAQIYAFQALARLHPALAGDLYLQNTSQDQYTVFSPFYAGFIARLGLENAAGLLTVCFSVWFFAAAWSLAAALAGRGTAWLATALLIIVPGDYGGSGVFRVYEQFLTARLPAEALILTAFALQARGLRVAAALTAMTAFLVHPLMAFPGMLLLICLWVPARAALLGAAAGVTAALCLAAAAWLPAAPHVLGLMDAAWLEVVRERSQFLFLNLWSPRDWDLNIRPLLYLTVFLVTVQEPRARMFCAAATLVGVTGLIVACVGALIGPAALLIQGQAWRWIWPADVLSVVLLPLVLLKIWRDPACGALCAVLLAGGWLLPPGAGSACALLALLLWLMRDRMGEATVAYLRWAAALAAAALLIGCTVDSWPALTSNRLETVCNSVEVRLAAGLMAWFLPGFLRGSRRVWQPAALASLLLTASLYLAPVVFKQARVVGSEAQSREFTDWTDLIPATSTVLVAPAPDVGTFVWFTLRRPNYLALDQSAGVVFSRDTALEVRRRAQVLLPLTEPTFMIWSRIRRHAAAASTRPLTAESLGQVCADPKLGFVIAPENVGFEPARHTEAGPWKDWNLYDCRHVRLQGPPS